MSAQQQQQAPSSISGPESLITQVRAPGEETDGGGGTGHGPPAAPVTNGTSTEDKLASLITQVQNPESNDNTFTESSDGDLSTSTVSPSSVPTTQPTAPASTAQANSPSATSTPTTAPRARSKKQSGTPKWKSTIAKIFTCFHCGSGSIHHDLDVDAQKGRNAGVDMSVAGGGAGKLAKAGAEGKEVKDGKEGRTTVQAGKGTIIKSSVTGTAAKKPAEPEKKWLLKPLAQEDTGRKCLVLDLDETLVHSSFKAVPQADFIIPVEIDNQIHNVYVLKRPGVDVFLQRLGTQFEVVVFTASLAKYADPVLDMLDTHRVVKHRLFREACIHHKGNYVKDLSMLGRDLKDIIIIDNSPASYIFHPTNAIPISTWFNDPNDTELLDLIPFLEDLKMVDDVMLVLDSSGDD
ncbi:hypothetical protein HK097_008055 [Rhizophlyctis rosea]|uniref:protein-serine/threonine phosphatase n=1 Tax=Rhizophlyctis rosea TaxID=64517 RepID=A0AAD5SAS1_9FUNG|nr:hypothetical protein HK097_008055 [Rhizophlyctis rosea]